MEPSSTRVGKHSRSCAVSVAERDHVYSRHASPRRHVCRCEEFEAENAAHSPRSGCRRLPQEWHCSPGTPVSCTWPQQGVTISQSSHRVLICYTCCCCCSCCSCCCCSRRFSLLLPPEPRRGVSGISAAHIASPPAASHLCSPGLAGEAGEAAILLLGWGSLSCCGATSPLQRSVSHMQPVTWAALVSSS